MLFLMLHCIPLSMVLVASPRICIVMSFTPHYFSFLQNMHATFSDSSFNNHKGISVSPYAPKDIDYVILVFCTDIETDQPQIGDIINSFISFSVHDFDLKT